MSDVSEEQLGVFDAIFTQRAIRSFKPDPVPREVIEKIVQAATKAPSGANKQPWAFVVIQDAAKRAAMAGYARDGFQAMRDTAMARMQPGDPMPFQRLGPMIEAFEIIPAVIVVCGTSEPGTAAKPWPLAGSVYPAVQNLLLAARGLGVGAALTTGWAMPRMAEIKELLELPEHVIPLVFVPLGYPDKERYGPTTRRPVEEVIHWDTYTEKANTAAFVHR